MSTIAPDGQKKIQQEKRNTSIQMDLVAMLGRELGQVLEATEAIQDAGREARKVGSKDYVYGDQENLLWSRQSQLEAAIPALKANSLAGALVSIIRASAIAGMIDDQCPTPEDDKVAYEMKQWHRDLRATLSSAAGVLRTHAPGVFESCGGNYYMSEYLDPFRAIEEAQKLIEERRSSVP